LAFGSQSLAEAGVEAPADDLAETFDQLVEDKGASRSETFRDLVRGAITTSVWTAKITILCRSRGDAHTDNDHGASLAVRAVQTGVLLAAFVCW
jgi:hypothetical protein